MTSSDFWRDLDALVGVACTVDGLKGQVEVKLLPGCTPSEIGTIHAFFSQQLQMGCRVWLREPDVL